MNRYDVIMIKLFLCASMCVCVGLHRVFDLLSLKQKEFQLLNFLVWILAEFEKPNFE